MMDKARKTKPNEPSHAGVYVRLQKSDIHGIGVFAIRDIPKGTDIFPDDNSEVVWHKIEDLNLNRLPESVRRLYEDFCLIQNKGRLYGCPKNFNLMTVPWYLNHSKKPNVRCDKDYRFFASEDIPAGTELTVDYETYNDFRKKPDYIA